MVAILILEATQGEGGEMGQSDLHFFEIRCTEGAVVSRLVSRNFHRPPHTVLPLAAVLALRTDVSQEGARAEFCRDPG